MPKKPARIRRWWVALNERTVDRLGLLVAVVALASATCFQAQTANVRESTQSAEVVMNMMDRLIDIGALLKRVWVG